MKKQILNFSDERRFSSPLNKGGIEGGCAISLLVIHSFASKDFVESCEKHKVSAHYTIDLDGTITQYVEEKDRAWHAGIGSWREFKSDINSHSIGIEVKNETLGQTPFNDIQIEKLIHFCNKIIKKYNIKPENVVGHSDIAPTRKADPGFAFPWKKLAKEGVGLWYQIKNADKMAENNIEHLLSSIGYNTSNLEAAAYAFCRRFLPEYVKPDLDIKHLVDNVLTDDFGFMKEEKFLKTLKAVAYTYKDRL